MPITKSAKKRAIQEKIRNARNKVISINVPALFSIIDKVESISELIQFFSRSPLDDLKQNELKLLK